MRGQLTGRRGLFTSSHYAIAFVIAGLCGGIGCKRHVPPPQGLAQFRGARINDALWVETAYWSSDLYFAVCYDVKHKGTSGTSSSALPDGSQEEAVNVVAHDGFSLNLKFNKTKPAFVINGKEYPNAAGNIFHCKMEGGKVVVDQYLIAPELMKGNWSDTERIKTVLESIPELRAILKKEKSE